jgi:PAS domain S-box-containing protein
MSKVDKGLNSQGHHNAAKSGSTGEPALTLTERRFLDVLRSSPDAILLIDDESSIDCNESTALMLGYSSRSEFLKRHPSDLSPQFQPDGRESLEKAHEMMRIALEKGFHRFEWIHRKANGEDFPVEVSLTPFKHEGTVILYCVWRNLSEQKRIADALVESQERMNVAFEHSPIGMSLVSLDGFVIRANTEVCAMLGYPVKVLETMPIEKLIHADDLENDIKRRQELLDNLARTHSQETRYVHRNGKTIWTKLSVTLIRNAFSEPTYYIYQTEDIGERKRAEDALKTSRTRLSHAMDLANLVSWEYDVASDLFTFDDRFYAFLATTAEREGGYLMLSKDYATRFVHPEDAHLAFQRDEHTISSIGDVKERRLEHRIIRRDGEVRFIAVNIGFVRDSEGKVIKAWGANQDITERKRMEEELRQRKDFIEQLLEHSPIGFAVHKIDDGQAVFVSRIFESIYGLQRGSLTSIDDFYERVFPDDSHRKQIRERIEADIASHDPSRMKWENIAITTADGEHRVITAINIPLFDQNVMISTVQDVTEQRNMQMHLAQAQKLESIGSLAAGIAHEINTPTQFVSDNMRFLKEASVGVLRALEEYARISSSCKVNDGTCEYAAKIRSIYLEEDIDYLIEQFPLAIDQSLDGLTRIASIVRAMKDFSHPDSQHASLTNLNAAIQSTVAVSRNEWKYVAEVKLDLDDHLPMVSCYIGKLNQVILNLIVNAAQAIGDVRKEELDKGLITISTRHIAGDNVEILISDTGSGIPESIQAKVFDPFFTTKEVGKGTGQGLSMAHNVVTQLHHGSISFTTQIGAGTTFRIVIPVNQHESSDIREAS